MDAPALPDHVARFRDVYRREHISPRYNGHAHLAFTSVVSLAVIGFAASRVTAPVWWEWLVLPLGFLVANAAEYFGHRGPMHRPRRGLGLLFQRHTQQHHHFYTHDAMAYGSPRDFHMVLFPPVLLLFFLGGIAVPMGLGMFVLLGANAGWLFVVVAMGYYLTYEWLHFSHHLPESHPVARLPFMKTLRQHHTHHHDLALMGKWNFNITFPICDVVMGTIYRP